MLCCLLEAADRLELFEDVNCLQTICQIATGKETPSPLYSSAKTAELLWGSYLRLKSWADCDACTCHKQQINLFHLSTLLLSCIQEVPWSSSLSCTKEMQTLYTGSPKPAAALCFGTEVVLSQWGANEGPGFAFKWGVNHLPSFSWGVNSKGLSTLFFFPPHTSVHTLMQTPIIVALPSVRGDPHHCSLSQVQTKDTPNASHFYIVAVHLN